MALLTISGALDVLGAAGTATDALATVVWTLDQVDWLVASAEGHGLAAYLDSAVAPYRVQVSGPTAALASFVEGLFVAPIPALTLAR